MNLLIKLALPLVSCLVLVCQTKGQTPNQLTIALGQSTTLTPSSVIESKHVADTEVCRLERLGERHIVISGTAIGKTTVTLLVSSTPVSYSVIVRRDPELLRALETSVSSNFDVEDFKLEEQPRTGKVVAKGRVPYYVDRREIMAFLECDSIKNSDLLCRIERILDPTTNASSIVNLPAIFGITK